MAKKGKKYVEAKTKVEVEKKYPLTEAVALVKEVSTSKFVGTLELHVCTNANPKYNDQILRGTVVLPHGTWKKVTVAAFVGDENRDEATKAWADIVWNKELIADIEKGNIAFDILVTTGDQMRDLAKVARQLGPKGLMPSPKAGTVTGNLAKTIDELKKGRVEYKLDKTGNAHLAVGKLDFDDTNLIENVTSILDSMEENKPVWVKGNLIKKVVLAPTMGPWVQVDV